MWMYGSEKAAGEAQWSRRWGYRLLGEMHIPGRLRVWHVMKELRRLGMWQDRPLTICDAGGGEGALAYHLAHRFPSWRVVVADNSPETLARGRRIKDKLQLDGLELRHVDLLEMEERDNYDVVICSDVLEHIRDDQRVVDNLARALRPGGVLVVTSPSTPQPPHLSLVKWRENRIGFTPEEYGHVRQGYDRETLDGLFRRAGLTTDAIRWTFGPYGTLMFDLFFVAGDSRPFPPVYAGLFPVYLGLAAADLAHEPSHGAAILGVARRP
jgi:2-polyprenyl-3-methyl-5-hydroxy-6-metoxy-1,4-benzoquinol methylase